MVIFTHIHFTAIGKIRVAKVFQKDILKGMSYALQST